MSKNIRPWGLTDDASVADRGVRWRSCSSRCGGRADPATGRADDRSCRWWPPPPHRSAARRATSRASYPCASPLHARARWSPLAAPHPTPWRHGPVPRPTWRGGRRRCARPEAPRRTGPTPISPRTSEASRNRAASPIERVGGSDGTLVRRHAGMVGQLQMPPCAASRTRCRARCRARRRPRRRPRSRPRAARPEGWARNSDRSSLPARVHHAAVATARPRPDVVAIEHDDGATRPRDLPRRGQARVPASDHGHVDGGRQRHGRGLGQVDLVPPVGPGLVVRASVVRRVPWGKVRIGRSISTTPGAGDET